MRWTVPSRQEEEDEEERPSCISNYFFTASFNRWTIKIQQENIQNMEDNKKASDRQNKKLEISEIKRRKRTEVGDSKQDHDIQWHSGGVLSLVAEAPARCFASTTFYLDRKH